MTFVRPASERWEHDVPAATGAIDLREPELRTRRTATELRVTAIDLSSLRVVAAFLACSYAVLLVSCTVLWVTASTVGLVAHLESFIRDVGFDTFRFAPLAILRALLLLGVVLVAAGTAAGGLAIVLYNRLAARVPGIRLTISDVTE
ncbi:MAG: DUF3566 domain-containing protein [Acidobacteria bacterium]|nr:DUF3566 domain-containing protein [Acidobacteriota bacterium]